MRSNNKDIIAQNKARLGILYAPYDPILGIGSPVERKPFCISGSALIYLPVDMFKHDLVKSISDYGSLFEFCKEFGGDDPYAYQLQLFQIISKIRITYDFEFWAATCCDIQDKETKKVHKFLLRRPQLKLLKELEDMRLAGVPIRIILLKARQWGGSTLVQMYMAWIQLFHRTRWHSAIVGNVEEQARNIRGMYQLMANGHPADILKVKLKSKNGSSKNKEVAGRDCGIDIGSMEKPENLRSPDYAMLHCSEVGSWKKTKGKTPEDMVQSVRSVVPAVAYSLVVLESTAKGVGNFFHNEWLAAESGKSGYKPVFVAYFEIEMYQMEINDYDWFISTMTEYEWFHWECGATLEAIYWYRCHQSDENMSDWRMKSEFPANPAEAFNSTGRRAFNPLYVRLARRFNRPPIFRGDIVGDAAFGPEALKNINFAQYDEGCLSVWEFPDQEKVYKNRYIVPVDIGGRSDGADYSVIRVIDRWPILDGGVPEVVLTWIGHLDQDLVVWKAAQIAKVYSNAELIPESNSLTLKAADNEGDHIITVLEEILPFYDNIYMRTDPEKVRQGAPAMYGFHTNTKTKTGLIDNLNKLLRTTGYIEPDKRMCDECDCYEFKADGTYGAVDGQHDDILMCTSIGLSRSNTLDPPCEIILQISRRPTTRTAASF